MCDRNWSFVELDPRLRELPYTEPLEVVLMPQLGKIERYAEKRNGVFRLLLHS